MSEQASTTNPVTGKTRKLACLSGVSTSELITRYDQLCEGRHRGDRHFKTAKIKQIVDEISARADRDDPQALAWLA